MDIDELDDDDEWIAFEGDGPNGQTQLEIMNVMLGTEDVHVIRPTPPQAGASTGSFVTPLAASITTGSSASVPSPYEVHPAST
jgi:patatin-like phospholipase/acyl hydrolase